MWLMDYLLYYCITDGLPAVLLYYCITDVLPAVLLYYCITDRLPAVLLYYCVTDGLPDVSQSRICHQVLLQESENQLGCTVL